MLGILSVALDCCGIVFDSWCCLKLKNDTLLQILCWTQFVYQSQIHQKYVYQIVMNLWWCFWNHFMINTLFKGNSDLFSKTPLVTNIFQRNPRWLTNFYTSLYGRSPCECQVNVCPSTLNFNFHTYAVHIECWNMSTGFLFILELWITPVTFLCLVHVNV